MNKESRGLVGRMELFYSQSCSPPSFWVGVKLSEGLTAGGYVAKFAYKDVGRLFEQCSVSHINTNGKHCRGRLPTWHGYVSIRGGSDVGRVTKRLPHTLALPRALR